LCTGSEGWEADTEDNWDGDDLWPRPEDDRVAHQGEGPGRVCTTYI